LRKAGEPFPRIERRDRAAVFLARGDGERLLALEKEMKLPNSQRAPFALTAYSLPHVMGYLPTKAGRLPSPPMDTYGLMDAAAELGLAGVEMMLPSKQTVNALNMQWAKIKALGETPPASIEIIPPEVLRQALEERGLRIVADYRVILEEDAETIRDYLKQAAVAGATVVRALLSSVLCGDRRSVNGGWDACMEAVANRLREVLPAAEELGLCIAMENHQDAASEDLLRLYDMTGRSPAYGITLDTGNPLSVGEDPTEAARRMAPLIRQVHLKDYTIHFAPEGYRLVRCAAGTGVIDFPAILEIVRRAGHDVLPGIESAAQPTRTIPILEPDWWRHYPSDHAKHLIPALKILWEKGRPADEPYSSAWERGADSQTVADEEWDVLRKSVDYFKSLEAAK
jgi:sugar phosphate isomerase/epimerase